MVDLCNLRREAPRSLQEEESNIGMHSMNTPTVRWFVQAAVIWLEILL